MTGHHRIATDPDICGGRPHVRGTRLTVEFLLQLFEAGWSEQSIVENYPQITSDDVRAVFAFARSTIEQESFVPSPAEST